MRPRSFLLIGLCLLLFQASLSFGEDLDVSVLSHLQRGDRYFRNNQHYMAINEYEEAIRKSPNHAVIYRRLALVHYELGYLDDAVAELEHAASLSPDSEFLRMELGIAYLAKGRTKKAKEQFMAALKINPGLSNAYYYLGEIGYREKEYGPAWMYAKRAQCLGHSGRDLTKKLQEVSAVPEADPCVYRGDELHVRQILVSSEEHAEEIMKRISWGELFEDIALEIYKDSGGKEGGYLGKFRPSELHPSITDALLKHKSFSPPEIVRTESGYHIVQRVSPFDQNEWKVSSVRTASPPTARSQGAEKATDGSPVSHPDNSPQVSRHSNDPYLVYAGSYREEKNAADAVSKLQKLGFSSYRYVETNGSKGPLHIVVAGRYESLEKAREAGEEIARSGFSFFISRSNQSN